MITFITEELKESPLKSLDNKEVHIIPFLTIFSVEKSRKCFLGRPLDRNPFKSLRGTIHPRHSIDCIIGYYFDGDLAIHIILNLLYRRIRSKTNGKVYTHSKKQS
jgi:hypothetical protein